MIEVEELDFTYDKGDAQTLFGLSFQVTEGAAFGLLGPSGAGKSTTQSILIGLRRKYTGRVEVMGKPLEQWGGALYREIGVSFEFTALFPLIPSGAWFVAEPWRYLFGVDPAYWSSQLWWSAFAGEGAWGWQAAVGVISSALVTVALYRRFLRRLER